MKVQIKDLKPNPFRDMVNYPIEPEKIRSLTNSINQTGFWDNILARKNNGKIEIAYGHHRLVVLKELFKPDDYVDIPIKELNDETMIKIMANENNESWGAIPKIINETMRAVKQYLKKIYSISDMPPRTPGSQAFKAFKGLPLPKPGEYQYSIIAWQMSEWLGGNWPEHRVYDSLECIGLIDRGELDETIESLPTEFATKKFVKAVKRIKDVTTEQQKRALKKIIKDQDFSESGMRFALYHEKPENKMIIRQDFEFENSVVECTREMRRLNEELKELLQLKKEPKPGFKMRCSPAEENAFDFTLRLLINTLRKFLGKEEQDKIKELEITDD